MDPPRAPTPLSLHRVTSPTLDATGTSCAKKETFLCSLSLFLNVFLFVHSPSVSTPGRDQLPPLQWGVVLWAFDGANEGEIPVPEGARVIILSEVDEWLDVEYEGEQGYIPRAYVELVEEVYEEPLPGSAMEEREDSIDGGSSGASLGGTPSEPSVLKTGAAAMGGSEGVAADPEEENRKQICYEILATEENYVKCLDSITINYKASLEALAEDETSGIDKTDIKKMFSNIDSIAKLNGSLHDQLSERLAVWNNKTVKIGDIFAKMAPVLIIYTEYANMYQEGLEFYNTEKKKNQRFAQVCEENKAKSGMDLEHLLIMPVQRVPRYNLLLEDLYKKTPDEHEDKEVLLSSEKMVGVADGLEREEWRTGGWIRERRVENWRVEGGTSRV